jgi:hypothetical protein
MSGESDGRLQAAVRPGRNAPFYYPRLAAVESGYGARSEFDYEDDTRGDDYQRYFNYRVKEMRTYDGVQPVPGRVEYAYGQRCYDQSWNDPGDTAGGELCRGRWPGRIGPLAGHEWVKETILARGGETLSAQVHRFYIDDEHSWRMGREYAVETYTPDGQLARQAEHEWARAANSSADWARLARTTTDHGGEFRTQIEYEHDAFGNLIREERQGELPASPKERLPLGGGAWNVGGEGAARTGDEVIVERAFVPNLEAWIVSAASVERVLDGAGVLQSETHYAYDGQTWDAPPTRGLLTHARRGELPASPKERLPLGAMRYP